ASDGASSASSLSDGADAMTVSRSSFSSFSSRSASPLCRAMSVFPAVVARRDGDHGGYDDADESDDDTDDHSEGDPAPDLTNRGGKILTDLLEIQVADLLTHRLVPVITVRGERHRDAILLSHA